MDHNEQGHGIVVYINHAPFFTGEFSPVTRVTLYLNDESVQAKLFGQA